MSIEETLRIDTLTGVTYVGYSVPGVGESENLWKIKKIIETGTTTLMLYPSNDWGVPDTSRSYSWTNRASYTYLQNTGKLCLPPKEIAVYDNQTKSCIAVTRPILSGVTLELKVLGGQIGDNSGSSTAQWTWYDDSVFTSIIGYGESLNITSPATDTTYYVKYTGGINTSTVGIQRKILIGNYR